MGTLWDFIVEVVEEPIKQVFGDDQPRDVEKEVEKEEEKDKE